MVFFFVKTILVRVYKSLTVRGQEKDSGARWLLVVTHCMSAVLRPVDKEDVFPVAVPTVLPSEVAFTW